MQQTIYLINGPNLNLLGVREPHIYGKSTLADVEANCRKLLPAGWQLQCMHSNHEGQIIDWIQQARTEANALVINPGALAHTSIGLLDALQSFPGPALEVHVSNIYQRESFRHHSYASMAADGVIAGLGVAGYELAVSYLCARLKSLPIEYT